jgi:hypothetical protein
VFRQEIRGKIHRESKQRKGAQEGKETVHAGLPQSVWRRALRARDAPVSSILPGLLSLRLSLARMVLLKTDALPQLPNLGPACSRPES